VELAEVMPGGTEEAMFDAMWRLPHPDAAAVLTLIASSIPTRRSPRARRFAYKASSRQNSQR